ncbi:hypothetical protein HPP92_016029 [Vanilla planifolia]|uniref:Uncharacterized protein n=1 Tax=Vanilla planifolia TaxID=51239 RepID=A0A835QMV4_VANPL|nr:hypothetical protein HPP92_016643 [Vanilla planifolia]KAG0471483.1 hypothetical protein HPP92_016029 [Vanilla planifolia]
MKPKLVKAKLGIICGTFSGRILSCNKRNSLRRILRFAGVVLKSYSVPRCNLREPVKN